MIVVCPSCQQHYRHAFGACAAAIRAHCSACDERFDLAPPKRRYVLIDDALPPTVSSVEIELPRVETAGAFGTGFAPEVSGEPLEAAPPPEPAVASPVTLPAETAPAEAAPAEAASAESEPAAAAARAKPRHGALLESLVALVPCSVGGGLAYHFAGLLGQDPITWAALGGAIGLLLGWACLLWITRGD
jgi:hypothetical protein